MNYQSFKSTEIVQTRKDEANKFILLLALFYRKRGKCSSLFCCIIIDALTLRASNNTHRLLKLFKLEEFKKINLYSYRLFSIERGKNTLAYFAALLVMH
jgi:hypothetical protein